MVKLSCILRLTLPVNFLLLLTSCALAQDYSNLRQRTIVASTDTTLVDTLSLVNKSLTVLINKKLVDTSCYTINESKSNIYFLYTNQCQIKVGDTLTLSYRVLPVNLSKVFYNKALIDTTDGFEEDYKPFFYKPKTQDDDLFSLGGISKSGSISRGISFGNNQDVVVNSSLNLQLNGRLSEDVNILAAITDNNIPFQAEGNTQQLQEFDKVFIQLYNENHKLTAGDFELQPTDSYFLKFFKKGQGALYNGTFLNEKHKSRMSISASGAISKGKFVRNTFAGEEQNQGPYKLQGAENENFIIVLSGTEKVYIDGRLLKRGQENDYIIDYNTSEITFTANQLITKDIRIVVEFEYSDRNYSRSFLFANTAYETDKLKLSVNAFSEQDSKNQPLDQDVDASLQSLIASVGDNLDQALVVNADSVGFNDDEILYAKVDTPLSADPIFIYSTNPDSAFFRVGFSFVGLGNGNYIPLNNNTNGRVFLWVEPVNNIPQGSYEPVRKLISPKKQQWLSALSTYKLNDKTSISLEGVFSNNDINLYSDFDKSNDKGYALKANVNTITPLNKADTSGWNMQSTLRYEWVSKTFNFLEPFRNVEFSRDWSINNAKLNTDENLIGASFLFTKTDSLSIGYGFKSFLAGSAFEGFMNDFIFDYASSKYDVSISANYMRNKGNISEGSFLRGALDISRNIQHFKVGLLFNGENNPIYIPGTDSLTTLSTAKENYGAYVKKESGEILNYGAEFTYGVNYLPSVDQLKQSDKNNNLSLFLNSGSKVKNNLSAKLTFRQLNVKDSSLSNLQEENSVLGKVEYTARFARGFIRSNTYFEFGSGQELRREFSYVKVPAGTGVYAWNDYNGNGIKELSEFEIALFADEAEYIRVFTPTNEFIKARTNKFNQILNINPHAIMKENTSKNIIGKFSLQSAIRYNNKLVEEEVIISLNPFININDSNLVSTTTSIRNTLFYNKNSSKVSADGTYQILNNKAFLTGGFDYRNQDIYTGNLRWNFTKLFSLNLELENKQIVNRSDFSENRNFDIDSYQAKPIISYQGGAKFRLSVSYSYADKSGSSDEGVDNEASIHDIGSEARFSSIKQGIMSFRFNYVQNDFTGDINSPTGYELLQGLNKGTNYLWNAGVQRNLSKSLQLSINYDGRKSEEAKAVHTGSMQVRAFF